MKFLILLLILAAVAAIVYFILQERKRKQAEDARAEGDEKLDIRNVRPGGVVALRGVGPDLEDFDVVVDGRHVYEEDGFEWFELEGSKGTGKVWIEVEEDDELEVSVSLRKLSLSDLGTSPEQLEKMIKEDEGSVTFEGVQYEYEDWGEATFYRNGERQRGERVKYWDFESEDGTAFLSIEQWGRQFEVHLSESLRPSQIEVFTNKA